MFVHTIKSQFVSNDSEIEYKFSEFNILSSKIYATTTHFLTVGKRDFLKHVSSNNYFRFENFMDIIWEQFSV